MNMKYEKPKTKKNKGQETDNETPDSDSGDEDGEPKFKETVVPAKWWAQLADGHHKITQQEDLEALFGARYIAEVMARGKSHSSNSKFIDVPVGAVREPRRLTCPSLCVPGAPVVFYQQGIHDTCVFSSMAAALYFAGAKKAANQIQNAAPGMVGCNVQSMFHSLVRRIRTTEVKFLSVSKLSPSFDWKNDLKDNMILVGSLEGSDGSVHHAVTLFRGWLFDSNETHALPLTKQALDFCTQTEEEMTMTGCASTFCRFKHGTIYTDTTAKEKLKYISASASTPKSPKKKKHKAVRPHEA
jgi:hypothetical protein